MAKRLHSLTANRQTGQFLINLAEVLVSAGLVIGAAFQAQVLLQDYQFESYYGELKDVETVLWEYKSVTGLWPGDCDADGVIDIGERSTGLAPEASSLSCAYSVKSEEATQKVFMDLASVGLLDDALRTKFADDHTQYMQLAHDVGVDSEARNMLIAFDVTTELAQWLDVKIDGRAAADVGRIRRWGEGADKGWVTQAKTDLVTIAYYFDSKI